MTKNVGHRFEHLTIAAEKGHPIHVLRSFRRAAAIADRVIPDRPLIMSHPGHGMKMVESLKSGLWKRLMVRSARKLLLVQRGLVWFSLLTLSRGLPAQIQTQQPFPMPEPGNETPLAPQTPLPGSISGTVTDETGAVIVGATVALTSVFDSAPQEALSAGDGQFFFADVVPGPFQITITAEGFGTQTLTGSLHSGEPYNIPPRPLAPATQTTVVVSAAPVEVAEAQVKAQEKQRMLAVIPNFYVTYIPDAVPLSTRQKFRLAGRVMIDPYTIAVTGLTAGVQQANNDFSGYGQGVQGYAKRFGAAYADNVTGTFLGGAVFPSLLKQDPRYFYKGTGSAGSRILYAIAMAVVCKGDNQRWQPNYSAVLGSLTSGAISYTYYPEKDRGLALVFEHTAVSIGESAVVNLFQEFVIRRFTTNVPKQNPSPDANSKSLNKSK